MTEAAVSPATIDVPHDDQPPWAVICGGGTAGHVVPAIAIAQALVARGHPPASIHFIGSDRGIESRLVPEAGFGVTLLPGRGIERRLSIRNLQAVAGLAAASVKGVRLVARRRPRVVVSVGGYASLPGVAASAVLRVPLVVVEQNAAPGAANRLAARVAQAAAVSFPGTPLPGAVVTGNPVRPEVLAVDRSQVGKAAARRALDVPPDATLVLATGGSLGARTINNSTVGLVQRWRSRRHWCVYHVVGTRDWEAVAAARPELPDDGLWYRQVRYEDRMDLVYAAADMAVCRAGATTVSELAVVGLPAVLIPLPGAPSDHQTANARALVDVGAARLVSDAEASPERLAAELDAMADPATRSEMSQAAATVARRQAADEVAALVERVSTSGRGRR